ncbi:hypothetical protein [Bordetella genomosp. 9]|uniref:hypothetical protein n=1 Tax=Bordetella genomosp. 9 TaxID=1416803 RepID=UPI001178AF8A|nr:hypothetical protein [Bordetella genomosp. 9]
MKPTPIQRSHARPAARWPMLLAAVAIACSLTACGGDHDDDDDAPSNPDTPTQPTNLDQPGTPQPPAPVMHCAP